MTDQGPATPSATNFEGTIDATTQAVVTDILSSLHLDKEKMQAVMNLPPTNQADNERLALAIRFILRKHFSMDFPATEMERVRQTDNAVIKFQEESRDRGLPARSVAIMLTPGQSHFEINGVPPQDGRDAFSELFFSWKKQAGAIDQQGNIDLKRLNAFPTIQKDKLLASIYLQTQGTPGVDALGKSIKPRPGRPMKVRFNDEIISRRDDPEDPFCFQLVAARSGIIDFSLAKKDEPTSLQHLNIVDTITINGDVNYKVGDLASLTDKDLAGTVNIVVKGNVLGISTLQSEGFIHVQGSIEAKKVVANEVKAEVIGSNTSVLARESLVAGTVIQALVSAGVVVLKGGSNESVFQVSDLIRLERNCSCQALKIETRKLEADQARFSGQNVINLGRSLFEEEKEIQHGKQAINRIMEAELPELRELAKNAVDHLINIEFHTNKAASTVPPIIPQVVGLIKTHLTATAQQMHKAMNPNLIPACFRLQAMMDEHGFHESVLRKVETLVSSLRRLDEKLQHREGLWHRLAALDSRGKKLQGEVRELYAEFTQPQITGSDSEIHLVCGEQKLLFSQGQIPKDSCRVCYELADDAESLSQGKLVVSKAV